MSIAWIPDAPSYGEVTREIAEPLETDDLRLSFGDLPVTREQGVGARKRPNHDQGRQNSSDYPGQDKSYASHDLATTIRHSPPKGSYGSLRPA